MKAAVAIPLYAFLFTATAVAASYFVFGMPGVSSYLHVQSQRTPECRDARVRDALLDFTDRALRIRPPATHFGPRWTMRNTILREANWSTGGDSGGIAEIGQLLWTELLISDSDVAGVYCQRILPARARALGIGDMRALSDRDLFALAGVNHADRSFTPGTPLDFRWLFQQLRALPDKDRMAEEYWSLREKSLRPEWQ